ncbi:O-antigen ligase family protein [Haemophilus parahaemolyticus]|uniref:O-antigen ligase family protein n=1 Tax=Haemophilus parahaemolyticus TaxID=735 RepID=UPI0024920DF6|nr:O-antigen ligase [Haemophilus parahaemolyticus]
MLIRSNFIQAKHFTLMLNLLVALFFATVLVLKKGYSYVPMALGAISIIYSLVYFLKFKQKWQLAKEDKWLIFSFLFYFITFLLSIIINKDSFREIDNPSRILLFIPLLLLFNQFSIKIKMILYSIPAGAIITGLVALFQKFQLGYDKPFPEIMHIQVGNIAISLATFSLVIAIYFTVKREYKSALFSFIGVMLAMSTSALSGARGGWVGLPIVLLTILFLYRQYISKKLIFLLIAVIGIGITTLITNPKFGIEKRYNAAKSDITLYLEKNNKNTSLGARFDMWENALIAIKQAPLFGHGSKGYEAFKDQQIKSNQMAKTTLQFNSLHNQYLESWVKRGLIGFIGLMLITLTPLVYFIRNLKNQNLEIKCTAISGITHILSHLFYFTSQSFLAHNSGSIFYFFVCVIFFSFIRNHQSQSA